MMAARAPNKAVECVLGWAFRTEAPVPRPRRSIEDVAVHKLCNRRASQSFFQVTPVLRGYVAMCVCEVYTAVKRGSPQGALNVQSRQGGAVERG